MGRDLFEKNRVFRHWMRTLDDLVRQQTGASITARLYSEVHRSEGLFDRTLETHPAIFMVEFSLAQCLIEAGVCPGIVLGSSLGSFAAAAVAGFLSVEDALGAVIQQATAFEEECEPGGMVAILANAELFRQDFLRSNSDLAADLHSHFVVSAKRPQVLEIESALQRRNVSYQSLPVTTPFHSRWIEKARNSCESFASRIGYIKGRIPLACCEQAGILLDLPADHFWKVVRNPIRFHETVTFLEQQGPCRYIDVGPGATLATLLKYGPPIQTKSATYAILSRGGHEEHNLMTCIASTSGQAGSAHDAAHALRCELPTNEVMQFRNKSTSCTSTNPFAL
jgi:bacillaene synthase trans-acting acyltransferase